jgi:hypothetical protein
MNTIGHNRRPRPDLPVHGISRTGGFAVLVLTALLVSRVSYPAEIFDRVASVGALSLEIQPDPRGEALGGAYSALTMGPSGVHWNPAGLAFAGGIEIADQGKIADAIDWPADLRVSFEAVSVSVGTLIERLPAATFCIWRSRSTEAVYIRETTEYEQEGAGYYFDIEEEATGYSYAHRVTRSIGVGVTYKRIETEFADSEGEGNGLDLGCAFHGTRALADHIDLRLGAAAGLRNLGSLEVKGASLGLPRQGYVGLAPTLRSTHLRGWPVEVTLAGELAYDDPRDRWVRMGGIEVKAFDALAARYGWYKAKNSERDASWGLGGAVRYGDIIGLGFGYSNTDLGILGEVGRYMLTVGLLACSDGFDIRALIRGR